MATLVFVVVPEKLVSLRIDFSWLIASSRPTKSDSRVSAGAKLQQEMTFARKRQGSGDEGRGALWAGSLRGTDRGSEPAGSGAAVWDRPADIIQDAGVLGSAGLPAEQAASASKARPVHQDHRRYPGAG